jgi:hypothetical protein
LAATASDYAVEVGRAEQRPPLVRDLAPELEPLQRRAVGGLDPRGNRVAAVAVHLGRIRSREVRTDGASAAQESDPGSCEPSHRDSFHS